MNTTTHILDNMYHMGVVKKQDILYSKMNLKGDVVLHLIREPIKHFSTENNNYRCILSFRNIFGTVLSEMVTTEESIYCIIDGLEYYINYDPSYYAFACGINKVNGRDITLIIRTEISTEKNKGKLNYIDIVEYIVELDQYNTLMSIEVSFIEDLPKLVDLLYETFVMDLK